MASMGPRSTGGAQTQSEIVRLILRFGEKKKGDNFLKGHGVGLAWSGGWWMMGSAQTQSEAARFLLLL